jgi:hypothetical protein
MTYTPLQPDEIRDIEKALKQDPGLAYVNVLLNLDDAKNPQEFARALGQASIVRRNLVLEPDVQDVLNSALARNSRRMGVTDTDYEEIISPILYRNSPELPSERAAESFTQFGNRQDWAAARTGSEKLVTDTRKIIASTKRIEDLDELDVRGNGSIYRMFAAGELTPEDAKKLIDQVNYRRINLLQAKGVISKSVKNNTKEKGGVRGIALLEPSILRGSDGQKAQIYKAAIQTSESSDELAQVYSIIQSDVTSPAYLDVLEEALTAKTFIIGEIEDVARVRAPQVARSAIDEDAILSANRAQTELDAARFEAGRPENRGDVITVAKRDADGNIVKNSSGEIVTEEYEQFGGGGGTLINTAVFNPPKPRPNVKPTDIRLAPYGSGYTERTVYNAQNSDATIAVARDFDSPGEILTANAARGRVQVRFNSAGKAEAYYPGPGEPRPGRETPIFQINHGDANYQQKVDEIVEQLNQLYEIRGAEPLTINFAGNSLVNLGDGTVSGIAKAQSDSNAFARNLLDGILDHPNRNFEIGLARSGGQHGYDTAFIKAASENGIPTGVRHPSGQYGGVMVANPIDETARPIFLSEKQYLAYTRGNIDVLLGKL